MDIDDVMSLCNKWGSKVEQWDQKWDHEVLGDFGRGTRGDLGEDEDEIFMLTQSIGTTLSSLESDFGELYELLGALEYRR